MPWSHIDGHFKGRALCPYRQVVMASLPHSNRRLEQIEAVARRKKGSEVDDCELKSPQLVHCSSDS